MNKTKMLVILAGLVAVSLCWPAFSDEMSIYYLNFARGSAKK